MSIPGVWTVIWKKGGADHLLDFDDEAACRACGVGLAESGRENVMVSGPQLAEVDPERLNTVRERNWAAIVARLQEEKAAARVGAKE